MKKITRSGLSAGMAIAFMFAMTLNLAAQEKRSSSTDKAEVEFVEAKTLANTVQKLNSDLSVKIADTKPSVKTVDEAPLLKTSNEIDKPFFAVKWFLYTGPSADDPNYLTERSLASNYQEFEPTETMQEPDCEGDEQICAVEVLEGAPGRPDQTALNSLIASYDLNHIKEKYNEN